MPQSGDFFKTVAKRTVKDRELERIIATITNMNTFTRNVRNQAARKIQKAWKSGKRREARQLVRNLQAGIVDNLANELKKLNLTNKNKLGGEAL